MRRQAAALRGALLFGCILLIHLAPRHALGCESDSRNGSPAAAAHVSTAPGAAEEPGSDVASACPVAVPEQVLAASKQWQPLQPIKGFCNGSRTYLGNPVAYHGNPKPMLQFFRRAATGERLSVVVLGGSVASCHVVGGHGSPNCWSTMVQTWFSAHYPHVNVTNKAMPATTSSYAARCANSLVPENTDLVIIEFALNDYSDDWHTREVNRVAGRGDGLETNANRLGYERLVRKLAKWPSKPAILGLQFWTDHQGDGLFWRTAEDEIQMILKYYQMPSLSFRDTYFEAFADECPCFSHAAAFVDMSHPNQLGNSMLARVVTMYFDQMMQSIPRISSARSFPSSPMRVPTKTLFPGNEVGNTACTSIDDFRAMGVVANSVANGSDWRWVDGDKPGFVGETPGAQLNITYPLAATEGNMSVALAYVRSYHSVGMANISCWGRCTCEPWVLDGYHTDPTSQTFFAYFDSTAVQADSSPNCTITVVVSNTTRTEGHQVKISALSWEEGHKGKYVSLGGPGINVWNKGDDGLQALH